MPSRLGPSEPLDLNDIQTIASLIGRKIVAAEWIDTNPHDDWTGHEEARLKLDDGRIVVFGAWGHDAWGATVRVEMEG